MRLSFMHRILTGVLKNRKAVLIVTFIITLILIVPMMKLRNDNSIEVWLDREGHDYVTYREFEKEFRVRDGIIAAVEGADGPSRDSRQLLNGLAARLRAIEGIESVYHYNALSALFPERENNFRHLFISAGGDVYAFWIYPAQGYRGRINTIIGNINSVLKGGLPEGTDYHLAGPPVLNSALDRTSSGQSRLFFPLVILLSSVLLLILFRSLKILLVCLTVSAMCQIWSLSMIAISGNAMNMVTTALPPLLWVLSLSSLIYMIRAVQIESDITKAVLRVLKPCSFTVITTAAGFLSLCLSHVGPVRQMGIFTSWGMGVSLLLSFTIAPVLLSFIRIHANTRGAIFSETASRRFSSFLSRHTMAIAALTVLIAAACIVLSLRISVDTNNLNFFSARSTVYKDYTFIGEKLTGHSPLEIGMGLPPGMDLEEALDVSRQVSKELLPLEGVRAVITPVTFSPFYSDGNEYVNRDATRIRLSVLTDTVSTRDTQMLIGMIRAIMDNQPEIKRTGMDFDITGVVQLLVKMQDELLGTQIRSFSLAFAVIAAIFFSLLRSVRYTLIAMVPNIFPIIVNLGIMGLFRIPLNVATIMVASVAIGIAVDDTIHFVVRYRDKSPDTADPVHSVGKTLSEVGGPVIFTTLINTAGFSVLMFSGFMPIHYFGILMVMTLAAALLADLFLLPALLIGGSQWMRG